jgi:alcohol dehydrogenase class IV
MSAQIVLPSILEIGHGARLKLPTIIKNLACKRPLFITDPTMLELGVISELLALFEHAAFTPMVFADVMPEPDDSSIKGAVKLAVESEVDCLIAVGGGSAIDSAKAIALLATHGGEMRDYKVPFVVSQQSIPVVAVPTTAGTGSECTKVTIISDTQSSEKMLCMGAGLMPKVAIVDYELTNTLPFRVAADTGIDALTHAIEAYISKKANLFSDQQAIAAMKLIAPNLITACCEPHNEKAKEAMMLGSCLAGIAFSNASVALVHGMSRPIGVHFHVPHGMSNAMLLPTITRYSLADAPERYAECAVHMGLSERSDNIEHCHELLMTFLSELNHTLKVPSMSAFGIKPNEYSGLLETMASQALASGSPGNNPRTPSKEEIIQLYRQVFE